MHESAPDIDAENVEAVTAAVLTASRLLVSVSARSLGAGEPPASEKAAPLGWE